MSSVLLTIGFLVAALVGSAALLKAARWSEFRRELGDYGLLPKWLQAPTAVAVPLVEAAGVLAFVLPGTRQVGAGVLALLLCIFAGVLVVLLAQGRSEVKCACFGHSERTISWVLPVRNLVLAFPLAAIVGLDVSVARLDAGAWVAAAIVGALGWLLYEYAVMNEAVEVT